MGKHSVEFSRSAAKDYKKLPAVYKALIDLALTKLSEGLPLDIKPLKGEKNVFRIRVGSYRMLYMKSVNSYLIIRIDSPQNIYK